MNQINDVRKQLNIEPGNIALGRGVKSSLVLIDTFFGFEPPQTLPPYVQDIGTDIIRRISTTFTRTFLFYKWA
ncbi:unnamed protein product [Rhizophagus irregularis]|uniref:Uncharacterized protein n=1 Tax=Rhizophagus irregularis TaxID=588596 RepID=A0A916EJX3_9GLOM|nr:unnamed protein product [Rhizophagus irregularis]